MLIRNILPCLASPLLATALMFAIPLHAGTSSGTVDYLKARQLTNAVGRIMLSHQATLSLLGLCAEHYSHLSDSVRQATSHLAQADKPLVDKAHHVQQYLVHSIAEQQNSFNAERFALEIDVAVENTVSEFRKSLANYPRQDRHYVCNRLILSVHAGEWDARTREPEAAQTLHNFELRDDVKIDTSGAQPVE